LQIAQHYDASAKAYLYSTQQRFELPLIGQATYTVTVLTSGDYYLWARVSAMNHNHNSFYVAMDDASPYWYEVEPLGWQWNTWFWDRVYPEGAAPGSFAFDLSAGEHTLRIGVREAHTRIDRLALSPDADYVPCDPGVGDPDLVVPLLLRRWDAE